MLRPLAPQKRIFVSKNGHVFLVKAIRADLKGFFILKRDLIISPPDSLHQTKKLYKCDRCPFISESSHELYWHYLEKHARHTNDDDDD